MKISLVALALAIALPMVSAECQCLATGDPHYTMCDKQTKFDFQAEGLFTAFKSQDLEVQIFQKQEIGKPYAIVDYCSIKYVKDGCTFVMKSRSISAPNKVVINGQNMPVTSASQYLDKEIDKTLGITMDKDYNAIFNTKDGIVHVACQPWEFLVRAPNTKQCEGLCGDCSGKPQTKPAKPLQYAAKDVHQTAGSCKPKPPPTPSPKPTPQPTNATTAPTTMPTPAPTTPAPTTPAPTTPAPTTPAPTTPAPTSAGATPGPTTPAPTTPAPTTPAPTTPAPTTPAPTTPAPTTANVTAAPVVNATSTPAPVANATTMPTPAPTSMNATTNASLVPPPVKEIEKAKVVGHPVFESEDVMKKVVHACMCGQPKERMDTDKQFGGFVENCIYDKSLGPDDEGVAASNMEAFLKTMTPIPDVIVEGDNITVVPAPALPAATVVGNVTYSNANFATSAIREKHVTKFPSEIAPTAGVSYRLRYMVPDEDVALIPELMPRAAVFTGAGERSEPIMPTPAQQMAMTQLGMHSIPSAPTSPSMPAPMPSSSQQQQQQQMPASQMAAPMSSSSQQQQQQMPASQMAAQVPAPGAPVSYLAPNNAPMPARPPMPMRPDNGGDRFPAFGGDRSAQANGNDDNKLKVHFDLEAPIFVKAQ